MEDRIGEQLKALAEPTRYAIVRLLLETHHCSRSLSLALDVSESAISQHMSVLKECGLVSGTRHGYHIHYSLDRDAFTALHDEFGLWLARMEEIKSCFDGHPCDYRVKGCCNSAKSKNCKRKGKESK